MEQKVKIIIFCGLDGSGKSTQAKKLIEFLQKRKIHCEYFWLRYPDFLSLPFVAFVRLFGMSVYLINQKRLKSGIKNLKNHVTLQKMWQKIFFSDLKLSSNKLTKAVKKRKLVVVDRFVLDSIVDLMITTDNQLNFKETSKKFLKLIPMHSKIFYFDIDPKISYERNNEEGLKTLQKRRELYLELIKLIKVSKIDASKTIEEIHSRIIEECKFE